MIRIYKFGEVANDEIFARVEPTVNVEAVVTEIIDNVRKNGDKALFSYCERFDGAKLDSLLVRLKACSIEGSTGPIIPVSRDPINTPIRNSRSIKLRVFLSKVLLCMYFFFPSFS